MKNLFTILLHIVIAATTFSSAAMIKTQSYDASHFGLKLSAETVTLENVGYSAWVDANIVAADGTSQNVQKTATWTVDDPSLAVADDGRILALKKGSTVVIVSAMGYSRRINLTIKNDENLEKKYALKNNSVISTAKNGISHQEERNQIVKKCSSMINYEWTVTQNLYGFGSYIFEAGKRYTGIPYSYTDDLCDEGGFDSARSSKYFYKSIFIKGVAQPYFGSDCSGFVCLAWGLAERENTESFIDGIRNGKFAKVGSYSSYTPKREDLLASYAELQPGDAVVMREGTHGHTFIIADNEPGLTPPQVFAYEQTPPYSSFTNYTYDQMANLNFMPFKPKTLR